jgi:hypothetical protein
MARMARKKKEAGKMNRKVAIGLAFVLIMVLSSFGVMIYAGTGNAVKYKGIKFNQEVSGWSAKIDGKTRYFVFHPLDVEDLKFDSAPLVKTRMAYLTFEPASNILPDVEVARMSLSSEFAEKSIYLVSGTTEASTQYNLPIITCANATSEVPVILIRKSQNTSAAWEGNCLVLDAYDSFSVQRLKDRLTYAIFKVI